MHLSMLLDMAMAGHGDRVAFGGRADGTTYVHLATRAAAGAAHLREAGVEFLVYVAPNSTAFPVALFAAAAAGVPLVPINYRLGPDQLAPLLDAHRSSVVIVEDELHGAVDGWETEPLSPEAWLDVTATERTLDQPDDDPETVAMLLYTSGTTAAPKAAILRNRHLAAYVMSTVEFGGADEVAASLVSVPPYHIAGVSNTVSNVYAGRRVVHLDAFSPEAWLETVREEGITHALVVPTMLARVVEHLEEVGARDADVPTLASLAYGGAPMPHRVIARALELLPTTAFVNAYGLTETSSTVAVLGPEEHRAAAASDDPVVQARLGSAGVLVPGIEAQIRADGGAVLPPGEVGELFVRGEQVSGEYVGRDSATDAEGWFATRDRASIDAEGYLFIEGRTDDTIIRGGENIAPAEIEAVLCHHDAVADAAVLGLPDEEWGQVIAAVVVTRADVDVDELRSYVREHLRGSKTPERIEFRPELPRTDTGKLLRRVLLAELSGGG
ncbi:MAG: fatty acid--CoA ligase family protein [Acidimicrobiia bacterium]